MPVIRVLLAVAVSLSFYLAVALSAYAGIHAGQWQDVSNGIRDRNLNRVSASASSPDIVFLSAEKAVYKTTNGGSSWEEVFSFRGRESRINTVLISPINNDLVYAGTDDGLYRSNDGGLQWEKVFSDIGNLRRSVHAVAVNPVDENHISVGTGSGHFRSDNNGKTWQKSQDMPSEAAVTSLVTSKNNPDMIFAVTNLGLYKSINRGARWRKVLHSNYLSEDAIIQSMAETKYAAGVQGHDVMISIAIDPENPEKIFAGTTAGILVSDNGGQTWEAAGNSSLFVKDIRDMVLHGSDIYAATHRGVFLYSETSDELKNLYQGLVSTDIRSLESSHSHIWAVSRNRVYKSTHSGDSAYVPKSDLLTGDILAAFVHEPSVEEIREAAIQYAEVSPTKISNWRKAAARQALLPDVRFEYGKNKYWQNSDVYYKEEDLYVRKDDVTKDRDEVWSISLNWNLGDLIYNSAQTAIDNRSKLMVQLRDDILNEVTRLYYERRKLQVDLMLSPPVDAAEEIAKELRLQELTASIDSLTGSYLSKRLQLVPGAGDQETLQELVPRP
jgi:photosystem II stability/assembly factor-like uncharacterized protein